MEYTFASLDQYSQVHAVKWLPQEKPVAVLFIVHGMTEYIERYDEFARFLNERGFIVAGHDHIGHGTTAPDDSELGIMRTKDPSGVMVGDIFTHYQLLKKEYPDLPFYILGHSMGSYMVRRFLSEKAEAIEGLTKAVIMGTGTESDLILYAGRMIVTLVGTFKGWDYKSTFVKNLMFGAPYKEFSLDGSNPEKSWLSTDVEKVKAYYKDKYCTFMFSVNGYKALVDATIYDNKVSNIAKIRKNLPLLFISGAKDPVGGLSEGVKKAVQKFEKAGMENITLKLYEGKRHEILNEVNRTEVYEYLYSWLSD